MEFIDIKKSFRLRKKAPAIWATSKKRHPRRTSSYPS